jgi:hypothetical protein
MKCPHCLVEIHPDFQENYLGLDAEGHWSIFAMICPNSDCKKLILNLALGGAIEVGPHGVMRRIGQIKSQVFVNPLTSSRPPAPAEVDDKFASDYKEACLTLSFSAKASAALGRRCLQNILREKAGVKKSDLSNEIQEVIDSRTLPSHLAESIDAIRIIGNFAAHPIKSTSTGEIVEVEAGEAEWTLDVLESFFDFYFVQPAILKAKRDALNAKLSDAGKPPMK